MPRPLLRWRTTIGLAFLILITVAFALPFREHKIELQPDGRNLGTLTPAMMRTLALVPAMIPLVAVGTLSLFSVRFRNRVTPWKIVGAALILSLAILVAGFVAR